MYKLSFIDTIHRSYFNKTSCITDTFSVCSDVGHNGSLHHHFLYIYVTRAISLSLKNHQTLHTMIVYDCVWSILFLCKFFNSFFKNVIPLYAFNWITNLFTYVQKQKYEGFQAFLHYLRVLIQLAESYLNVFINIGENMIDLNFRHSL